MISGAAKISLACQISSYDLLIVSDANTETGFIKVVFVTLVDIVLLTDIVVLLKPCSDTLWLMCVFLINVK